MLLLNPFRLAFKLEFNPLNVVLSPFKPTRSPLRPVLSPLNPPKLLLRPVLRPFRFKLALSPFRDTFRLLLRLFACDCVGPSTSEVVNPFPIVVGSPL